MSKYIKIKSKKFQYKKDAIKWGRKEKKKFVGEEIRIEVNFLPNAPDMAKWEGILLKRVNK